MGITTDTIDVTKISKTKNGSDNGFVADVIDVQDFFERVMLEYNQVTDDNLAADINTARSIIPAGTGAIGLVPSGVLLMIVLVIVFSPIELGELANLGYDWAIVAS